MSVREEDRQRNCPSRGLGIAAAAIGVGVGAALYYLFSKREENPDASGSTSNWTDEEAHTLNAEVQRMAKIQEQKFREREWKVEECSICFESMQLEQEVMALPCSHRFHQPCILPWLQERQTCPNCRKEA